MEAGPPLAASWRGARLYTIGHSTRSLAELVERLRSAGVRTVVDIRTVPRSRRNPQFNTDTLPAQLRASGVGYAHVAALGGLRRARKDSPNTGWRNASFRGYADYMGTDDFEAGLGELHALLGEGPVALMCAEAVPWRCHRSLVADVLSVRGADVLHIIGESAPRPHRLTAFARAANGKVSYPAAEDDSLQLQTAPPFHLAATIRVLQRRPVNPVDVWEGECWRRALTTADGIMLAEVHNRGSIDAPDVHGCVRFGNPSAATRVALGATLRRVLGLDVQPAPLQAVAARERHLRSIAAALRGMRPPRFADLFETVINVFPFQQLSLDAGVAILTRLVHRFGESIVHDDRTYYAFPTADAIAAARLPALFSCGLSRSKAESLRHVARAVHAGTLCDQTIEQLGTPEALRALVELPGVGPWSAAVILLRGFGRLDVFPPGDVGAARELSALLHVRSAASLSRLIERFGDYRGYLYFYGIGASLLAKGVIPAAPAADS